MKYYLPETVFDAALDRMRRLFNEFEHVVVFFSGGKDSTVTLNLALRVAEEMGRLPLPVMFIDQEAEWQTVIDYIREVMHDPRVKPYWLQVPFKIFNATSQDEPWLMAWAPGDEAEWMRTKEPDSLHENTFGTDRFHHLFGGFLHWAFPEGNACSLGGVRANESPARMRGLTQSATYKDITWGKKVAHGGVEYFELYPLYDWDETDIWKAIHDNHWPYCPIYDAMYQQGVSFKEMRVSNLHHETAVRTLFYLQEIESDTWNRLCRRLRGVNSARHLRSDFTTPKELPPMFGSWPEYRDYLLEHLITDDKVRKIFAKQFVAYDKRYEDPDVLTKLHKTQIAAMLVNDYEGTKLGTFRSVYTRFSINAGTKGGDPTGLQEHQIRRHGVTA